MKILYLITKSERGGAQVHVLDLIRTLRHRIEPVVACGQDGFLAEECRKLGVDVHVIPDIVHPMNPWRDVRAVGAVLSLMQRCRADIVHGHTAKAGLLARTVGLISGIPSFYTVHAWSFVGTPPLTRAVAVWIERAMRFAGGTVIEVCHANFAMARKRRVVNSARHLTIWNGMPDSPKRARPDSHRPARILMVARFVEQKDHAGLLRALVGINEPWQLTLAGDGPMRFEVEQLCSELGLRDRVLFTGDTGEVETLLESSDLFVLASKQESLPLTIIEAMRAGLPVIATGVGGVEELVDDGATGYLIPHSDTVALREHLKLLIESPELRGRMGSMGRLRYVRNFRLESMAGSVLALYRDYSDGDAGYRELLSQFTGVVR